MKVQKRDGSKERQILIGLITDKMVLARLADKWDGKLFKSQWANIVGGWCFDYFTKYQKAPRKHIQGLYESWIEGNDDADTTKLLEKFLVSLSDEFESAAESSNSEFLVDLASTHFNEVRLRRLADAIAGDIDSGDHTKAESRISKWSRVDIGLGSGVNVLEDATALSEVFSDEAEDLFTLPGALGEFFEGALTRDAFLSFEGPEKRGKTWWLMYMAWRAMLARRRVAFFAVGDMSQNQMMRRFLTMFTGHPLKPKTIKYPTAIERDPDSPIATVSIEEREITESMSMGQAQAMFARIAKKKIKSKEPKLKLSCHPNSSLTVGGLSSIVQGWERAESWVPDVIIVDYADILAGPLPGAAESRDQVNATWKQLRALSQSWHNLVITATQTDARSYQASVIDRSHFSEDKRKMAHVTGMIGLNAGEEEKEMGLMRLNWVVKREGEYSTNRCVHVAGCLAIGNPAVRSTF